MAALRANCTKLHHALPKTGTQSALIGYELRKIRPEIHDRSLPITTKSVSFREKALA
jgi:hypothetical protein